MHALHLTSVATLSWLMGLAPATPASACIPLTGIVEGGGQDALDLSVVSASLEKEPFDLSNALILAVSGCSSGLETPISMRNLLGIDTAVFSVSSMYNPIDTALDIFGDVETSNARRRCQPAENEDSALFDLHLRVAVMYALVYGGLQGMPYCLEIVDPLMDAAGHPLSMLDGDTDISTPWGLAKAYVDETFAYMNENDGWNADGSMSRDFNRVPFSDFAVTDSAGNSWAPYIPKNTPYVLKHKKRWQPLMESDDLGYISTQEHVTPHIGVTARFFGFDSPELEEAYAARQLAPPHYKYRRAAMQVVSETRLTASDEAKQEKINFFDNKFTSLIPLKIAYFLRNADTLSSIEFYRLTVEVQLAIYNSVVLVWREKVRHDLPRPPSIVRDEFGESWIESYAGAEEGVQYIKASDWEPYIRTMPHSEFPSASACICQVFAEQVILSIGADDISPPLEFDPFTFSSWSAMARDCGFSRFWGGLHFEAAVPAGAELCGGSGMAESISASFDKLVNGDASGAIFKKDVGELLIRPLRLK